MPFITEDDLVGFHQKIDDLTDKNRKLDELNDSYYKKLKTSKIIKIVLAAISGVLLLSLVGCAYYISTIDTSSHETKLVASETEEVEEETVEEAVAEEVVEEEEVYEEPVEEVKTLYYTVQIGAYQEHHVNLEYCIKRVDKNGLSCYIIGEFDTVEDSEAFKAELVKLGLSGAHTVCMYQQELYTIKEARDSGVI